MNRKQFIQTLSLATVGTAIAPELFSAPAGSKKWQAPDSVPSLPETRFPDVFADGWTLALLPDTQTYTRDYPDVFVRQTQWLAANKARLKLCFVAHEGDIVDNNIHPEWLVARQAMSELNRARIPYSLTTGNHDIGPWGKSADRSTFLNEYFTSRDYRDSKASGLYEKMHLENSWHKIATPHGDALVVSLEFGPRQAVLDWAGKIVSENEKLDAYVVTHAFTYHDGTRYDWAGKGRKQRWNPHSYALATEPGAVTDASEMWERFISRHGNIRFVFSGHVLENGSGHLSSPGKGGRAVHQILANYQGGVKPDRGVGGGGFMRLVHFNADRKTVAIKTYSPWYDLWLSEPDHDFTVEL
jgi:hypothetical protein